MNDYHIERSNKMSFLILYLICHKFVIVNAYIFNQCMYNSIAYCNLGYALALTFI